MWIKEDEYFIRCSCGETDNMISFWFNVERTKDGDMRELFISQRIDTETFWQRLKAGLKYIFKPSELLLHEETIVSLNTEEGEQELGGLIKFLQKIYYDRDRV